MQKTKKNKKICSNSPLIRVRKREKTYKKACSQERNSIFFGAKSRHQRQSRYVRSTAASTALCPAVLGRLAFEEHAKAETDFLPTLSPLYIRLLLPYVRPVEFEKELSLWA